MRREQPQPGQIWNEYREEYTSYDDFEKDRNEAGQDEIINFSEALGRLFGNIDFFQPDIPMFSYDRPAEYFWSGIAEGLLERGFSEKEIIVWLQSKYPRWNFDDEWSEGVANLGYKMAGLITDVEIKELMKEIEEIKQRNGY